MKKHLLLALFALCALILNAQSNEKPDWENPEVFAVNKEDTRATSIPYPSTDLAKDNNYNSSPYYQSLNGT